MTRGLRLLLACILLLIANGRAIAGPPEDAEAADKRGDYAAELAIVTPAAQRGEAWAENRLARMCQWGDGVQEDHRVAIAWFERAANQHFGDAELQLGKIYEVGVSVEVNRRQAGTYYRRAGEHGSAFGWRYLKRLCAKDMGAAASDCAKVPAGTVAASRGPGALDVTPGLIFTIVVTIIPIPIILFPQWINAWKESKPRGRRALILGLGVILFLFLFGIGAVVYDMDG
jgi:hypothetical protein